MARFSRISCPGGVFHIISRCLEQGPLLDGEQERLKYLGLLAHALGRTDARVVAWCIMSTHVHLVVMAGHEPLARLTKPLNSGFATWKNRRDGRVGPVFASRPKMLLVEKDAYLLELVRYVHLNPVRAGVVARPEQSRWTSHRAYVGLSPRPLWLHCEPVLEYFSVEPRGAAAAFGAFVDQELGHGRRDDLAGVVAGEALRALRRSTGKGAQVSDGILGSAEFVGEVLAQMGKEPVERAGMKLSGASPPRVPGLRELVAATCEVLELDEETFRGRPKVRASRVARQVLTWLWVKQYGGSQTDLVRYLDAGSDQVSRWYGNAVDDLEALEPLMSQVAGLLPEEEPLLARSPADRLSVQVDLLKD